MAVVTLKDLMDPLTKIAKSTEETASKLDAVVAAVAGGSSGQLSQAIVAELQVQTDLLKQIATNTKNGAISVGGKPMDKDKLKEGAEAIKMLGGGASSLAFGLLTFMLVPKGAIRKFSSTIKEIMAVFDDLDTKKIKEGSEAFEKIAANIGKFARGLAAAAFLLIPGYVGALLLKATLKILLPTFEMIGKKSKVISKGADALGLMGDSLIKFAKGLVVVAIASIIGIVMAPVILLTVVLFAGAFALLGKFDRPIRQGARALLLMGRSLVFFSAGLVLFALASLFILLNPIILLAMVGTLVLISGAFALIGLFDKQIRKGAVGLLIMGLSLIVFSVGYLVFAMVTKDITLKRLGIQSAILIGVGAAVAAAGLLASQLIKGAIGVAAMGLGLLVFSLGYLPFAKVTEDMTLKDVGVQSGILLALGLEFAAAGAGALFILAGSAAFAAVGISLAVLSGGLALFKAVGFTEDDASAMTTTLVGIKSAFLGNADADEGFFAKLGGAITGAVDAVRMVEAAAGFTAAGIALTTLSFGLNKFKEVGWNDELSKELVTMLNGVTTAFALAGSSEQVPSSSFFGQMFGFKRTAVEEGINSVLGAGRALKDIAKGLKEFQSLIDSGVSFGQPDGNGNYEEGTLGYAVTNTVGFIRTAFAAVANEGNVQGGGFFDTLFNVKQNKVQEGIQSVMGTGKALKDIAEGLKSFQALIDGGVQFGQPDANGRYAPGTLGYAVTNTVGFVSEAFAAVASQGNVQAGGIMGSLFGIEKNKVAEGIDSVKGAGQELTNIATGLKTFQDMVDQNINWDTLAGAVKKSITFVGEAFASIGGMEQEDGWFIFSWDENLVQKGVESVKGAGEQLNLIANGLKSFQDMISNNVDFEKLGYTIKNTLMFVGDAFMAIGGKEQEDSTGLSSLFGISWDENLVQKGIENVKGAGKELENIAKGLQAFTGLKNPQAIAKSIKEIFTSIGDTFTYYYEKPKFKSQVDHMQGFISEISKNAGKGLIHKAAEGMDKMAAAINKIDADKAESFANLFKGAGELSNNAAAYAQLLSAVEDIRDALNQSNTSTATTTTTSDGNAGGGGGDKGLSVTLRSINTTLGNLNSTMSGLPGKIAVLIPTEGN